MASKCLQPSLGGSDKRDAEKWAVPSFPCGLPLSLLLAFTPWGDITAPVEICPDAESHPPCSQEGEPLLPGSRAPNGLEGPRLTLRLPQSRRPRGSITPLPSSCSSLLPAWWPGDPPPYGPRPKGNILTPKLSPCPQLALVRSGLPEAAKTTCQAAVLNDAGKAHPRC